MFYHIQHRPPRQLLVGIFAVDAFDNQQRSTLGQSHGGVGGLIMWKLYCSEVVAVGDPVVSHTPEEVLAVRAEATGIFSLGPLQRNLGGLLAHAVLQGKLVGQSVLLVLQLGCGRLKRVVRLENQAV